MCVDAARGPTPTALPGRPLQLTAAWRRALKHPRLMHYNRLVVLVLLVNLAVLLNGTGAGGWQVADGSLLRATSGLTVGNLAVAVLFRQSYVVNALFWLAGHGSRTWPPRVRWALAKVFHIGGVHVGAAVAGTAWLLAYAAAATVARVREPASVCLATLALAYGLVLLTVLVVCCASPPVRRRRHDLFEVTHRLGGWTAIALFWALTVVVALDTRGGGSAVGAVLGDWRSWLLLLITASIALPWTRLRRVAVTVERPSSHAAIVTFDYGVTPAFGATIGVSRDPLREWHSFAAVITPGRSGYRLLVSRAGDWTSDFIDDPPSHLWVRGVPGASLASVQPLYERVVYVVTGSGIGPCLGQILAARIPARLVWSVRSPRQTYGDDLVDEVLAAQPDAVVWDTSVRGKPDLVRLAEQAYQDFGADAVFCVSNQPATRALVHGMERRGVPAFGPIFDS